MSRQLGMTFFILLLAILPSAGQKQEDNSQILQQILTELKGIDQNLRTTQSNQILIAEFEMQQGVVDRATEAMDRARDKSWEVERDLKLVANDFASAQDHIDQTPNLEEKKRFSDELDKDKVNLAALRIEEQRLTTVQQDMQQRLKTAEDRLEDTENELRSIVKQNGKR